LGESLGVEIYTTRKSFAGKSLDRVNVWIRVLGFGLTMLFYFLVFIILFMFIYMVV
jgi:hypothetical protein